MYKKAIVNNLIKQAKDEYFYSYLDRDDLAPLYYKYKNKKKPYSKGAVVAATLVGAGMGNLVANAKGPNTSIPITALSTLLGAGALGGAMHLIQKNRKSKEEDTLDRYLDQGLVVQRKNPEDIKYFKDIVDDKADMNNLTDLERQLEKMLAKKTLKRLR